MDIKDSVLNVKIYIKAEKSSGSNQNCKREVSSKAKWYTENIEWNIREGKTSKQENGT
jgi:hypothetical protein